MKKKLTINYIKNEIAKVDYILLSLEYINALSKLKMQCNKNHVFFMNWNAFQQGHRCPICYKNNKGKSLRLSYEFVKETINKEPNYKLLSKEYKNAHDKLEILELSTNHKFKVSFNNFKKGSRCPICFGTPKHNFKYIKEYIEKDGTKLRSKEYINAHTKLKLTSPLGNNYEMTWNDFQQGSRCPYERYERSRKTQALTYEYVKSYVEEKGYKLFSKKYINSRTKLKLMCPNGHIFEISFSNFQKGRRCSYERYEKSSKKQRHSYEYVKKYIEKRKYELISKTYRNGRIKLKIKCPKGHIFKMSFGCFVRGQRCPICNLGKITSKPEKQIAKYVKSLDLNTEILENDRKTVRNPLTNFFLELDVWIPELKKAVEYNGKYYHSEKDTILRDKIKKEQCKKLGIDLLVIKEKDYLDDKEKCFSDIKNFLISV